MCMYVYDKNNNGWFLPVFKNQQFMWFLKAVHCSDLRRAALWDQMQDSHGLYLSKRPILLIPRCSIHLPWFTYQKLASGIHIMFQMIFGEQIHNESTKMIHETSYVHNSTTRLTCSSSVDMKLQILMSTMKYISCIYIYIIYIVCYISYIYIKYNIINITCLIYSIFHIYIVFYIIHTYIYIYIYIIYIFIIHIYI